MTLPHAKEALIDRANLHDYLLSPSHPVGRFKAAFFGSLGYEQENWRKLERGIRTLIESTEAEKVSGEYGTKYLVRGVLRTPSGRFTDLVTVWIVREGEHRPRFVTAYPGAQQ
jgi:hypothetical protein